MTRPKSLVELANDLTTQAFAEEDAVQAKFNAAVQDSAPKPELDTLAAELFWARRARVAAAAAVQALIAARHDLR